MEGGERQSLFGNFSRTLTSTLTPITNLASRFPLRSQTSGPVASNSGGGGSSGDGGGHGSSSSRRVPFVKKIKVVMYNFGSPRVGNGNFASYYDKIVPNSYRVVVDGDLVTALPPQSRYTHVGTEILIDSVGAGSIIIDPSFVERWLRTHMKSSVAVHSLLVYRKGLLGIKLAAEFMRENAAAGNDSVDPLRLALKVRAHHEVDSILDENSTIAVRLTNLTDANGDEEEGGRRDDSVSDRVEASLAAAKSRRFDLSVGARRQRDKSQSNDEGAESPASDVELMEDISTQINPLRAGGADNAQRQQNGDSGPMFPSAPAPGSPTPKSPTTSAHDAAALHYANDVKNMDDLVAHMNEQRLPGPVKWMKRQASKLRGTSPMRERDGGGTEEGGRSAPPTGPDNAALSRGRSGREGGISQQKLMRSTSPPVGPPRATPRSPDSLMRGQDEEDCK
jgi:hypothetical protein